ncbi:MAG: aspartate kinase [Parachlamydiaceae bacterium]|nr:aspartate kinase [Parachlamydiaceae bacterium]
MNKTLVMKFGGASVAAPENFAAIASLIAHRKKEYNRIIVVVSAMGDTTDQLIALAKQVHPNPPKREYDMLITVGERISISLLAMALSLQGQEAASFTGSQTGIITCPKHSDARIIDIRPHRILPHLELGKIVIIAGFQGVSQGGEITTLGRGGSDTSAVAIAIALNAEKVEFFKDVEGIFSEDPKINSNAKLYSALTYDEALEIASTGAEILHSRCILLAKKNELPLHIRSFNHSIAFREGTHICNGNKIKTSLVPSFEEAAL